jgi:radical SAM superfamily enzyme YgiQ (UPF0313 family)
MTRRTDTTSSRLERESVAERLARESGTLIGQGRRKLALVYPSPYAVGMSSLGFQQVYRLLNSLDDTVAERAFLDNAVGPVMTYEGGRPISNYRVLAFSVASELELLGFLALLSRAGIPLLACDRCDKDPYVVVGGPLSFANPLPLAPFADVIVMGEAEGLLSPLCDALFDGGDRRAALRSLAGSAGFFVPAEHGSGTGELARSDPGVLPAFSAICTPDAALASMTLVEAERGCSRACTFCVMRREASGGMRLASRERILAAVPSTARRVGLVGAAVSDHPQLDDLVEALVSRGCEVSLSSLRADRLSFKLARLLAESGARSLTVAADGASERLRALIQKAVEAKDLVASAEIASELGYERLKCYVMVGMPGENEADVDELGRLALELAAAARPRTRVVLGVSPFVPKRRTPLANAPFAGVRVISERLERLRRTVGGIVEVRGDSPRWAWVEYVLAQSGPEAGLRAFEAYRDGGSFAAFRRAFAPFEREHARQVQASFSCGDVC